MEIRRLIESDAGTFQDLRLRALREHPESFLDSYETELVTPVERVAAQLEAATPANFHLGAFADGRLVGMVHFYRQEGAKLHHRALIGELYVTPERRGQGIGKALLESCIEHARTLPELEDLVLWVILGNERAKALYESIGFEVFCIEPRTFKIDGRYYDGAGMIMLLN